MPRNLAVSAFALFLVASSAQAATLQVGTCVVTPYLTIQSAVDAATAGDIIDVCPGTYPELVTVNKTLTILGEQSGVDPRTGTRTGLPATESVVTGASGSTSFHVTANDVVIDGFTIQGSTNISMFGAGVVFGAGTSGTELRNNIIQNNIVGVFVANNSASNQAVIQRNLIRNNNNPGPISGTGIYSDQFVAGGTVQNVLIDQNTFTGHSSNGGSIQFSSTSTATPATNVIISNNLFSGEPRALVAFNLTSSAIVNNTMENSTFVGSADLRLFEGINGLTITGNTMRNGVGVRALRISNIGTGAADAANVNFNQNSVTGYTPASPGVVFEVDAGAYTGTLNAECNWWGSATGPTHPSNPGGTGQSVSDGVDFKPWLDGPPPGGVCVGGAVITVSQGNNQSAQINTAFTLPLQVTVTVDGSPLAGVSVTFTAPASGPSGTFGGPTTVTTNASGVATAPTLTANGISGAYQVTASLGSSLSTSFNLTNFSTALSVLKTDGGDVYVNEPIIYTISITNSGTGSASNVTLTDPLEAAFVSLAAPGGWTCTTPAVGTNGTVTCSISSLAPGTAIFTLALTAPATPGTVNNTATVTAATEPSPLNASQSVAVRALPLISIADASLSEGNSGTSNMSFTVTLSGTAVRPASVQFATAPGSAAAGSDYLTATGTVDFPVGVTSRTITVPIRGDVDVESDETFVVNLSAAIDAAISDGQATGTIVNDDAPQANLSIHKAAPARASSGAQINYAILVRNNGPGAATNVVVTDPLPFPATAFAATPSQGSCSGTSSITCNLGTIAANASATIVINASTPPTFEGSLTNTASVIATEADPVQTDNSAAVVTAVAPAVSVPTTTEWGLILLALALATIGAWRLRT